MNEKNFAKFVNLKVKLGELHAKSDSLEARAVHDTAFDILKDHAHLFTNEQYKTLAIPKTPEPK